MSFLYLLFYNLDAVAVFLNSFVAASVYLQESARNQRVRFRIVIARARAACN
jgi:hypothetical protein